MQHAFLLALILLKTSLWCQMQMETNYMCFKFQTWILLPLLMLLIHLCWIFRAPVPTISTTKLSFLNRVSSSWDKCKHLWIHMGGIKDFWDSSLRTLLWLISQGLTTITLLFLFHSHLYILIQFHRGLRYAKTVQVIHPHLSLGFIYLILWLQTLSIPTLPKWFWVWH